MQINVTFDLKNDEDIQSITEFIKMVQNEPSGKVVEAVTPAPAIAQKQAEAAVAAAPDPAPVTTSSPSGSGPTKADADGWIKKDPEPANFKKVDPATKKATVLKMGFTPGTTVAMMAQALECTEGNILNHVSQLYNKHGFGYARNTKTGELKFIAPPKEQIQAAAVQPTVPATPVEATPVEATPVVETPAAPAPELPAGIGDLMGEPAAPVVETPGVEINDFDDLFSGSEDAAGVTDFLQ